MDQKGTNQDLSGAAGAGRPSDFPGQGRMEPESDPSIQHNAASQRFELKAGGAAPAFISYRRHANEFIIEHTFVPEELRGRGIAEKLARRALAEARHHHWKVVPQCSYVAALIRRNPEFSDLLSGS